MAVGYATDYLNWTQTTFQQRVEIAMLNAAVNISAEASATAGHALRLALATKCLLAPASYAPLFAEACVSDDTTTPAVTDSTLQNRVNSLWNALAGFDGN